MYLVEFFEIDHLEKHMLQDVFGIHLFPQFWCDAKNFSTLSNVKLQIIVGTCEEKKKKKLWVNAI